VNQSSEPIFNIPAVVVATTGLMIAIHAARALILGIDSPADDELLRLFAFFPKRYELDRFGLDPFPGGLAAEIWSFVTYAFLHGDFLHLLVNCLWFVPFGSAVARRFGPMRFLLFFGATAVAGAVAHLIAHPGEGISVIGASAAVSGMMAACMRFAFQPQGPIALWQQKDERAYHVPALPLLSALRDPRILAFLVIWFGLNLLFGWGSLPIVGEGQSVAWEAHIGGFLAGLLLFSLFDPAPKQIPSEDGGGIPL
jgi:membrane associated rhomboid family serine protease